MSSILVPLFQIFPKDCSNFFYFIFYIFIFVLFYIIFQMTENILILEGDHVSIKKNIYFYKRDVKKGLCPKLLQLQWKNL